MAFRELTRALERIDRTVRKCVLEGIRETSSVIEDQYEDIVQKWANKAKFVGRVSVTKDAMTGAISATGSEKAVNVFTWTDLGTKPHVIRAKNAPYLRFQGNYSARTSPIAKYNVGSGKSSGDWVQKIQVNHPGTEARQFSKTYAQEFPAVLVGTIKSKIRRKL